MWWMEVSACCALESGQGIATSHDRKISILERSAVSAASVGASLAASIAASDPSTPQPASNNAAMSHSNAAFFGIHPLYGASKRHVNTLRR
jgi:hypothetical protein